ncbi:outer membrane protein with beta-barrel domain [Pontibacter mucosus]|uniref:Outer membrane protein with beta-barrel domain n=2 Tax=Pontibacter TaxID=323449 RepID=A0A2T5YPR1_9BACT|nr:porin family protein [Pontibacter mucosus]PTX21294.1 outer membrane protein with beta-barrel domain [Pontibacter mucosus]
MKKLLLGLGLALMAGTASAQSVGIKAGLNYGSLTGDDAKNHDYRPGYTVGLTARYGLNELIGVQTEALFTSKGAKHSYSTNGTDIENRLRLNYLDIPVLLHLQVSGLYFELGPQVSFLLKGKQITEVSRSNTTTTTETDITDNPYPIDFGYAAGIGYRAPSGIGLGLRYNGGLKKLDDEGSYEGRERYNTGFQLTLSYVPGYNR